VSNHCQTLLAILDDGGWHTLREIQAAAFAIQGEPMTVHSRAAQLRKQGYVIVNESTPFGGSDDSRYRLVASPGEFAEPHAVSLSTPEVGAAPSSGIENEVRHAADEANAERDGAGERAPSAPSRPGQQGSEQLPPPVQMSLDEQAA
jgi:hypothetical protein